MSLRAFTRKPVVLTAVHANVGVERWYRDRLNLLLGQAHYDLTAALLLVWARTPPIIGFGRDELAADATSPTKAINAALQKWGTQWIRKFDLMSEKVAFEFASKSQRATEVAVQASLAKAGFVVKFKPTRQSIEAYRAVASEQVGLIKSIPQKYLTDVQAQVWQSVKQGGNQSTLQRGLRKAYGISERRAALIARDQNNKAKAVIENTRRQQLGIVEARWQHSSGGKEPRRTHIDTNIMNGKTYKLATGMYDPDEGENVWPGTLINCRCTSRAIIPGFE